MRKPPFSEALPLVAALILAGACRNAPVTAAPRSSAEGLTILTLNMAKEVSPRAILRDLRAVPAAREAAIILMQEVAQPSSDPRAIAETVAAELGREIVWSPAASGVTDQGLAILSRYPLSDRRVIALKPYDLLFRSRTRIALAATAHTPWGAVRIWNAHLDTRLNAAERLQQLAPVIRDSDSFPGPRVIGGDFNSNGFYWLAHVLPLPAPGWQATAVRDYMTAAGFASPLTVPQPTFDHLGMHLDWIWVKNLRPRGSAVYPMRFSDHHAVWVRAEP